MVVNEFEGRSFECPSAGTASCQCNYPDYNNDCQLSSDEILRYFEYQDVNKWYWFWVMWLFAIFLRVLFYAVLSFFNQGKRK